MATHTYIAAAAVLLVVSGCASTDTASRQDLASLRSEVRTMQRENADLARKVEALSAQLDLLDARLARGSSATGAQVAPVNPALPSANPAGAAAPIAATKAATAVSGAAPLVPSNLKVVKLEATPTKGAKPQKNAATSAGASAKAPPVPTSTPIQDPSAAALALLGPGAKSGAEVPASLEAALALSGLARARALENYVDAHPGHARACESLVEAARVRDAAGDPDGSCEDLVRAVAAYPSARSTPEALEGLAACEQRRGRPAEARRLQAHLAKDFPDSPAGMRAREHAPAAQGAAP